MRKTFLKVVTLLGVLGCGQVVATTGELRTPLARFPYHHQLTPVDDGLWSFNTYAGCYERSADKGFDVCNGTTKVPLAQLFFGKATFKGEEAFAGGALTLASAPAALKYVKMHPRFTYSEKGVNFAVETERRWDCSSWKVGAQLSVPFKCIDVERNVCSATMTDDLADDTLAGVVCRKEEDLMRSQNTSVTTDGIVPAYRLDFLSSLCRADGAPMVEYGVATGIGSLRIAGIELASPLGQAAGGKPAAAALYQADGTCPTVPYATGRASVAAVGTRPAVSGIGAMLGNIPNNQSWIDIAGVPAQGAAAEKNRAGFNSAINYSALGTTLAAQAKLYIVPGYNDNPSDSKPTLFETEAVIMMNAIEAAISDLQTTGVIQAEQYFYQQGVHFCQTERTVGLGDMNLDLYVGYDFTKDFWGKFVAGVVFPTGKKICDPLQLMAQAHGNNGHFEIKLGADFGWKACKWLGFDLDASYNFVLEATEWRGAPFKGATVKNIGPKIQAKTKWGYFTGHFDATVFHPENQNFGFSLGYEIYAKQCDKIKFCGDCSTTSCSTACCSTTGVASSTTAVQFPIAGCCGACAVQNLTPAELDASILAKDTNRISHKIRGEVFHRWNYCEIFAGASSVFAGKNIMKETECHVGCGINW